MDIECDKYHLVVTLSEEETLGLQSGRPCGERGGINPDAKVEVHPLSSRDPDARTINAADEAAEYLRQVEEGSVPFVYSELLGNEDLLIYPPDFMAYRRDIGGFHVPRAAIQTPHLSEEDRQNVLQAVPSGGVIVNFAGSISKVVPTGFPPDDSESSRNV